MLDSTRVPLGPEYDALTEQVIGAAIAVHRELGPGLLEAVYQAAMELELKAQGIAVEPQKRLIVHYRGQDVGESKADFVVGGILVVELKAVSEMNPVHRAQLHHYLRVGRYRLGLLLNFHRVVLREGIERVIL